MKTIKYTKMDKDKIINMLISGGILAFPTDTVFGLACIAEKKAIKKIYKAKGRDFKKPLPMMCSSLKMIKDVAKVNKSEKKLIEKFTPGPITIIFNKKENVEDYLSNDLDTIGIRIPDDEFVLDLIDSIKMPLMVTSANISNQGSLLKWEDVYDCMDGKIDGIVCEDARGDIASSIVDVRNGIKILREGPISLDQIKEALE